MFDLMKYKNLFIGFSGMLVILAGASVVFFGFKTGIDFSGGTLWQIGISRQTVSVNELERYFKETLRAKEVGITADQSQKIFFIRTRELTEAEHQQYLLALRSNFGEIEELRFESIGPAIGKELRDKAVLAFILVLAGIAFYIAFAFRKISRPVSSWKYGLVTLVTLFHDAVIPAGFFAFLGQWKGIELDTNFIVAILVIMGFSVHDTIVVFDRIRENLSLSRDKENLGKIINASVNQTFARSINTSLTLALVLIVLYFFGAASLGYFTLLILIGTIIGTYSSIFVASPLLTFFYRGGK